MTDFSKQLSKNYCERTLWLSLNLLNSSSIHTGTLESLSVVGLAFFGLTFGLELRGEEEEDDDDGTRWRDGVDLDEDVRAGT